MDDVARAAGISKGSLYLCFSGKNELFLRLAADAADELLERMRAGRVGSTGFERAMGLLKAYMGYAVDQPMRFRLAMAWIAPGTDLPTEGELAEHFRVTTTETIRLAIESVAEAQREGTMDTQMSAPQTMLAVWSAAIGALMVYLRHGEVQSVKPPLQLDPALWKDACSQLDPPADVDFERLLPTFAQFVARSLAPRQ